MTADGVTTAPKATGDAIAPGVASPIPPADRRTPTSPPAEPDETGSGVHRPGMGMWLWQWVRPHKVYWFGALTMVALQAFIELSLPLIFGRGVVDNILLGSGDSGTLGYLVVAAVFLMAFKGLVTYGQLYCMHRAGQGAVADLRAAIYEHVLRLPLSYFDRRRSGEMVSRMTSDVGVIQQTVTAGISDGLHQVLTGLGIVVLLFYLHWQLALVSFITLPLAAMTIDRFGGRVRSHSGQLQSRIAEMTSLLSEALGGMRVVKAFAMEEFSRRRFREENERSFRASMKSAQAMATVYPVVELILVAGMAGVLWFGGREVINGQLTLGELVSFLTYLGMATRPVGTVTKSYSLLQQTMAAAGRIRGLLDVEPERQPAGGGIKLPRLRGAISFEKVEFAYQPGRPVLRGIDLEIEPGEVVALVGPSGAGKTTLVQLLPRFYEPTRGTLRIDGYDVRMADVTSLREQIALVPQETVLFAGTVADNIAAGRSGFSREDIEEAARLANAHEFITRLPQGYDSLIGERGTTLSGGQRQRIAIARAILGDPRILIMDEATSALDSESERLIGQAMERVRRDRTTLIIAHRATTVQMADRIVVMEDGRVVQQGTHEQLLAVPGLYRSLYTTALAGDEAASTREPDADSAL